jgi:hypothetical protein
MVRPRLELLEERRLLSVGLGNSPPWIEQGPDAILNDGNTAAYPNHSSVGAVESVAVEPTASGNIAYIGTVNGGVWRCDNLDANAPGAAIWRPLTDQQKSLATSSMALDPLDPSGQTLWVGTGSLSSFFSDGGKAIGLLRTTDGGATWNVLGTDLAGFPVISIVPTAHTDPGTGQQVVLVAMGYVGILRSTDGGQTFQQVTDSDDQAPLIGRATDLIPDPTYSGRYYAAMPGRGVLRSDDWGENWTSISNGFSGVIGQGISSYIKLAAHGDNSGTVLYVAVEDNDGTGTGPYNYPLSGVYRAPISSSLGFPVGGVWSAMGAPAGYRAPGDQFAMVADPTNANIVYLGFGQRGDASANGGRGAWTSYQIAGSNAPHADTRHLAFFPNRSVLLETGDGGIYSLANPQSFDPTKTSPPNAQWTSVNGDLRDTEFITVAYDSRNGLILGGAQDNGNSVQTTRGQRHWTWTQIGGGDGAFVAVDNSGSTPTYYFMNDGPNNFFRDTGGSLAQIQLANAPSGALGSGLNAADRKVNGLNPFPFILDTVDPRRMLLGTNGVYESRLRAPDGTSIPTGDVIDNVTPTGMVGTVSAMAYGDLNNPNAAYVGTTGGGLYFRSSTGASFTQIPAPPWGNASARKIVMDPSAPPICYVLDSSDRVWERGIDSTWTELDGSDISANPGSLSELSKDIGEDAADIRTIELYDPSGLPGQGVLLAAGLGGVFRLMLGSDTPTWRVYGRGLPNVVVTDLHYIPGADLLLAGTLGRGAWTVRQASATLSNPGQLIVYEDEGAANPGINVRLDPANPSLLQVSVGGQVQFDDTYTDLSAIALYGGDHGRGDDTISVQDVPTCITATAYDAAEVIVGTNGSLGGIQGTLRIYNPQGTTSLIVDDSSAQNDLLRISDHGILGASDAFPGSIQYQPWDLSSLYVYPGPDSSVSVWSTPNHGTVGTVTTTLTDALHPNRFTVDVGENGSLAGIQGKLAIADVFGINALTIKDSNDHGGHWVTVDNYGITGLAPAPITYTPILLGPLKIEDGDNTFGTAGSQYTFSNTLAPTIEYDPGGGLRFVNVSATGGELDLKLRLSGVSFINLGGASGLDSIQGKVVVTGGAAASILTVDDESSRSSHVYTVQSNEIDRGNSGNVPDMAPIVYSNITFLQLYGGLGINRIQVDGTAAGTATELYGGAGIGSDEFTIDLYSIQGPLNLHGQSSAGGQTEAVFHDDLDPTPGTYTLTEGGLSRTGMEPISYDHVDDVLLDTSSRASGAVDLQSNRDGVSTSIFAGPSDQVDLGSDPSQGDVTLANIAGSVFLSSYGQSLLPAITIDDSGDTMAQSQAVISPYTGGPYHDQLNNLGPAQIVFGLGPATPVRILGGGAVSLSAAFPGDLAANWTLSGFASSSFSVGGNFGGQIDASALGTATTPIQQVQIGGSVGAESTIKVNYLNTLSIGGDLAGMVKGFGNSGIQSQPTFGTVTVGGTIASTGSIVAPIFGTVNVTGDHAGIITESNPTQDIQQLTIGGSLTSTGTVSAASIGWLSIGRDLAGQVTVGGPLGTLSVGGNLSGSVTATTIGAVAVGQNLTGQVSASQTLGTVSAGGTFTGSVSALTIQQAAVNGTPGNDTFVLTPSSATLNGSTILSGTIGRLTVNGNGGNDSLTFDDSQGTGLPANIPAGATNPQSAISYTLSGQDLTRSASYSYSTPDGGEAGESYLDIAYRSIGSLELTAGTNGAVDVEGTSVPTTVNAGQGNAPVNVGDNANSLDGIQGALTVNGQTGASTALTISDQGTATDQAYDVFATEVHRRTVPDAQGNTVPDMAPITYANVARLALYGGLGNNLLYVDSTAAGTTTDVYGGTGASTDEFWPTLYALQGPLNLHGQTASGGESYAILYDYEDSAPGSYTLTAGALNRTGMAPLTYDHLVEDILYTSDLASAAINVQSNAPGVGTYIVAGPGDQVTLGSQAPALGGTLANIEGTIILSPAGPGPLPSVTLDDSGDTADHPQAVISAYPAPYDYEVNGLAPAPIVLGLHPATPVNILGGKGNDAFTVAGSIATTGITIDGGGGTNSLTFDDRQATTDGTYTVTADAVGRPGSDLIGYANMGNLALYAGTGSNVVDVASTAAGTTTDLYGGAGPNTDAFLFDDTPFRLDDIQGPLHLHGQNGPGTGISGQTYAVLNDSATANVETYTLTAGMLNRSGSAPITYDHLDYEALLTSERAGAVVNVQGNAASDATVIALYESGDKVNFGSVAPALGGNLAGIQGTVAVEGKQASVVVDDSGDTSAHPQATLSTIPGSSDYQLNGLAPGTLRFSIDPASPVSILGGSGNDVFTVAGPIAATGITINGGGGTNSLTFDDRQTTADETYTVAASTVGRAGAGPIRYANMANLALYGGTGNNLLVVTSTSAGTTTDVYGGNGPNTDEFIVTSVAVRLDDIQGPLNLHGQNGPGTGIGGESNALFNDAGNAAVETYTLTAGALNRSGMAPINYDHLVADVLYTSDQSSAAVNVQSNLADVNTQISLDGSGDQVTIGSAAPRLGGTLANIQGSVVVLGSMRAASVVVDDSGDMTAHPQAVLSTNSAPYAYQLSGLAPGTLYFSVNPAAHVSILGGQGNDVFTVASPLPATALTIEGGRGNNTLVGPNTANTWKITGPNSGMLNAIAFAKFQNLVGGTSSDTFKFSTRGRASGVVNGGRGANTLDYSQYAGNILVDLLSGSATAAGRIANVQQVIGSQGNDLIVGDRSPSTLTGGTGRNILIGGAGRSTLDARRGTGDNILIGGRTDWDMNLAALEAIMAEWDRTDLGFNDRSSDLLNGSNGQGLAPLNVVNGQIILLKPATNPTSSNGTVHANAFADTLIGSNAIDPATRRRVHNWFLYTLNDVIENYVSSSDKKHHIT